jgi:hypothetical protein
MMKYDMYDVSRSYLKTESSSIYCISSDRSRVVVSFSLEDDSLMLKGSRWSGTMVIWDDEVSWWDSEPRTSRRTFLSGRDLFLIRWFDHLIWSAGILSHHIIIQFFMHEGPGSGPHLLIWDVSDLIDWRKNELLTAASLYLGEKTTPLYRNSPPTISFTDPLSHDSPRSLWESRSSVATRLFSPDQAVSELCCHSDLISSEPHTHLRAHWFLDDLENQ